MWEQKKVIHSPNLPIAHCYRFQIFCCFYLISNGVPWRGLMLITFWLCPWFTWISTSTQYSNALGSLSIEKLKCDDCRPFWCKISTVRFLHKRNFEIQLIRVSYFHVISFFDRVTCQNDWISEKKENFAFQISSLFSEQFVYLYRTCETLILWMKMFVDVRTTYPKSCVYYTNGSNRDNVTLAFVWFP